MLVTAEVFPLNDGGTLIKLTNGELSIEIELDADGDSAAIWKDAATMNVGTCQGYAAWARLGGGD
jgi:hypothetical protein